MIYVAACKTATGDLYSNGNELWIWRQQWRWCCTVGGDHSGNFCSLLLRNRQIQFCEIHKCTKKLAKSRILFEDANTSASAFHNLAKPVLVSNNLINNLQIGWKWPCVTHITTTWWWTSLEESLFAALLFEEILFIEFCTSAVRLTSTYFAHKSKWSYTLANTLMLLNFCLASKRTLDWKYWIRGL